MQWRENRKLEKERHCSLESLFCTIEMDWQGKEVGSSSLPALSSSMTSGKSLYSDTSQLCATCWTDRAELRHSSDPFLPWMCVSLLLLSCPLHLKSNGILLSLPLDWNLLPTWKWDTLGNYVSFSQSPEWDQLLFNTGWSSIQRYLTHTLASLFRVVLV